jgi:hypothetical protein
MILIPILFLSLSLLGIGPSLSVSSILGWAAVYILVTVGLTWIQFKTEVQKLVQPTRKEFTLRSFFEDLPYLELRWKGKLLLSGTIVHEMLSTIKDMFDSGSFTVELVNTNPDPKCITAPSGTYTRFVRDGIIGWAQEEPKPTEEKME